MRSNTEARARCSGALEPQSIVWNGCPLSFGGGRADTVDQLALVAQRGDELGTFRLPIAPGLWKDDLVTLLTLLSRILPASSTLQIPSRACYWSIFGRAAEAVTVMIQCKQPPPDSGSLQSQQRQRNHVGQRSAQRGQTEEVMWAWQPPWWASSSNMKEGPIPFIKVQQQVEHASVSYST
jgi:hypothetical protein